jgi:hypothetical protein
MGRRYAVRILKFPFGGRAAEYSEPPTVGVYLRAGNVYSHPYVQTTTGLSIFAEPVLVAEEGDDRVAEQLLSLLSVRRPIVPHPTSWKDLTNPLTRAAKVRSYKAFLASAKYVEVTLKEDTVSLVPTKNAGHRDGLQHLTHKVSRCRPIAADVQQALQLAFTECE